MKNRFNNRYTFKDIQGIKKPGQLENILGISLDEIIAISNNVESYYHPFIDVNPISGKERSVDRPTGLLKDLHTRISDRILKLYPLSPIVDGGVKNRNTRSSASNHVRKETVVRIDLKDCFHNITSDMVYQAFRRQLKFSKQLSKLLTNICTYEDHVPVGSPLSTQLVNITLDPMWREIDSIVKSTNHNCRVWVDDLIISGKEPEKLINPIKKTINSHRVKIGWHKLQIMRSSGLQEALGCSLNSALGIPKKKRRQYAQQIINMIKTNPTSPKIKGPIIYTRFINKKQGKQLTKLVTSSKSNQTAQK